MIPRPSPGAKLVPLPKEGGAKCRVRGVLLAALVFATSAFAHSVVDIGMSIQVPRFAPAQSTFTYHVIADDQNNDNGLGIVVTIVLPPTVKFSRVSGGTTWRCTESKLTVTCSAETVAPGP